MPALRFFFSKAYLLPLRTENQHHDARVFGHVDFYANGYTSRYDLSFWMECFQKGLYFPTFADATERYRLENDVYLGLWRAANRDPVGYGEGKYKKLCRTLIDRIDPQTDKECLYIAELYRNLGDFDASLGALRFIKDRRRWRFHSYAIERTAEIGYARTVKLNII